MRKTADKNGKSGARRNTKARAGTGFRTSVSFPRDLYQTLEDLAKQKKVSLAWVVRDAAEKYIAIQPKSEQQ